MLRSQDILLLLKLVADGQPSSWRQQDLAQAVGISQPEAHNALKRLAAAGLYDAENRKVNRRALLEFLLHAVKYVYPAQLGGPTRGMPTAWAAPPLSEQIAGGNEAERPVWPSPDGSVRGAALDPLYPSAPAAAARDPKLYELLALVDALRMGRARERTLAADALKKKLSA